jgi:hypothetical protein
MTGGPMPYVMDIGPYFSVLETRLNTPAIRTDILTRLRHGALVSDIAGLDSHSLDADGHTPAYRVDVLNQCWFGMKQNASGGWVTQPTAFPTGFWNGFQGDPHAILRAGLIRAIEVSLGIDHGAYTPGANQPKRGRIGKGIVGHRVRKWFGNWFGGNRHWPIEISWVCQGPFFQCWVTWIEDPGGGGHVSLTITTPAAKGLPVDAKITRPLPGSPEYACPPRLNAHAAKRGVWVLGHEDYVATPAFSTAGTGVGGIPMPTTEYRRKSLDVVCVAPSEWEGGVLAAGRPYIP